MTDAAVTPATIGGRFTNVLSYLSQPVVLAEDGGRRRTAGFAGSGSGIAINGMYIDDGSATAPTGNWNEINFSEGLKHDTWASLPFLSFETNYALGTLAPFTGFTNLLIDGPLTTGPFGGQWAYFDNAFNGGEAGPDQSWVQNPISNFGAVASQPAPGADDTTSVKTYVANQLLFTTPVPVSSFNSITAYAAADNPLQPASAYPDIDYEAAWDIFGTAHWDNTGPDGELAISLECMFWQRNHNQAPNIGVLAETGIDLNGDGKLWDLYMTVSTAENGGVSDKYSYFIWYLQDAYQEDSGWVDILAGVRYVVMHYVKTSGPGAPANVLDVPLTYITRGWEICSTNYAPLEFRLLDYRLEMS